MIVLSHYNIFIIRHMKERDMTEKNRSFLKWQAGLGVSSKLDGYQQAK